MTNSNPIWLPTDKENTNIAKFIKLCKQFPEESIKQESFHHSPELIAPKIELTPQLKQKSFHQWSVWNSNEFWLRLGQFSGMIPNDYQGPVFERSKNKTISVRGKWFGKAKFNVAEFILKKIAGKKTAIYSKCENKPLITYSYQELEVKVSKLANFLKSNGIKTGDVVAGICKNDSTAILSFLATASLGAIWSSVSPDFGEDGILERLGQINPKALIAHSSYSIKGTSHCIKDRLEKIIGALPSIELFIVDGNKPNLTRVVANDFESITAIDLDNSEPSEIHFEQVLFDQPLFILFSSGTTGKPKCIVHSAGGTFLEIFKEASLHVDIDENDVVFYQTTSSWMMWNWLVGCLTTGASIVLYDGYPFFNDSKVIFELLEKTGCTVFGTNPRFLEIIEKKTQSGAIKPPKEEFNLKKIRTILSTGSILFPEQFHFCQKHIKSKVQVSSISGGTDIVGCFALGSSISPVHAGELQAASFGLDVRVFETSINLEQGPIPKGEEIQETNKKGELVCLNHFPSMPLYFLNDKDNKKYLSSYFNKFQDAWYHGDYIAKTANEGLIFFGRSDATLNPGGVRLGTSEIYSKLIGFSEITDMAVVGVRLKSKDGSPTKEKLVLFLVLDTPAKKGTPQLLNEKFAERIKNHLKSCLTLNHVPSFIVSIYDLPRTASGKTSELMIKRVIEGVKVNNLNALSNPEIFADLVLAKDCLL